MKKVIVIGGGPAGMIAAGVAAQNGHAVTLLEKNEKPGKKLYLTGKGRCNLTNDSDNGELMARVNTNARFLYSAFNRFGSAEVIRFFEANGVPLKTERGRRVFPVSDRSSDIVRALERFMHVNGVKVELNRPVRRIEAAGGHVRGVVTDRGQMTADAVIVATGGLSYPVTGSTGDGYRFAESLGHAVTPLYPSLVPLVAAEPWVASLEGLSLKNIGIAVLLENQKKPLYTDAGEMLFTRDGISGPVILSASRYVTDKLANHARITVTIDLKHALTHEQLDGRVQRDFQAAVNKDFGNALDDLLPKRLIPVVIAQSGILPGRKVHTITRVERLRLVDTLKGLTVTPVAAAGYDEAVITMGGVQVREVNPSTMMSKKMDGLFFAGEVLDVDAMTGGYNLQIAFSTGYLAGASVDIAP